MLVVASFRFEAALNEANEADKLVATTDPKVLAKEKPFLGVPFTTKDCFAVFGLSWTTGLLRRKGVKADFDADAVRLIKDAGGIALGRPSHDVTDCWHLELRSLILPQA